MISADEGESRAKSSLRRRVAAELAEEILAHPRSGDYLIASEHELCRRFRASRVTIRLCLGDLEQRGLIYRRHGKGTYAFGLDTRRCGDLALIASPLAWKNQGMFEFMRAVQVALERYRSSLVLMPLSSDGSHLKPDVRLAGVVLVAEESTGGAIDEVNNRRLPFVHLPESAVAVSNWDYSELGRHVVERLMAAALTPGSGGQLAWDDTPERCAAAEDIYSVAVERRVPVPWTTRSSSEVESLLNLIRHKEKLQAQLSEIEKKLREFIPERRPKRRTLRRNLRPRRSGASKSSLSLLTAVVSANAPMIESRVQVNSVEALPTAAPAQQTLADGGARAG